MNKEELRAQIISVFDIARQEGMVNSKDGKHSLNSEADANDVLELISRYYFISPVFQDRTHGVTGDQYEGRDD